MIRLVPDRLRWSALSHRQRISLVAGSAAIGLVVVGVLWIVVTGLLARTHLNHVRAELHSLRTAIAAGDTAKAKTLVADITQQARSAHSLTTGPAWWVTANIPVLGAPLQTSRTIALQADRLGRNALPGVLRLADDLAKTPPPNNATIDLAPITDAQPALRAAAASVDAAAVAIDNAKPSWLPYVSSARSSVARELHELDGELSGASRAVQIALPMLGQSGTQRYFIGFLNEAESRGVGGIPGAFAIATADHGKITFEKFGSDTDLHGVRADVDLGADYAARYVQDDPMGIFQNSDISPDFRDAAQIWAGMWEKKTGQHIDGAIAIDPTALSYLLKVTGAATLRDGTRVTAKNVVALTQQTQYALFPKNTQHDKTERKDYLISIAKAVADRLTRGGNARELIKALSHAAQERRLVVWSANASIEAKLVLADWAGALGNPYGKPLTGFTVINGAASKLDYYLYRSMTYRRSDCSSDGAGVATLVLTNRAPHRGLPRYVTIRADKAPKTAKPGDNNLIVTYYASENARITRVTVDGKPVTVIPLPEGNALAASFGLELPAGASRTVVVTVVEPPAYDKVQVVEQPLVHPARVTTHDDCG